MTEQKTPRLWARTEHEDKIELHIICEIQGKLKSVTFTFEYPKVIESDETEFQLVIK